VTVLRLGQISGVKVSKFQLRGFWIVVFGKHARLIIAVAEAPQVEAILQSMIKAYGEGDLTAYAKFLDEKCSRLDERSKKMIEGKSAIVANLKELFASHAKGGSEPLVSFTVDQPYIKVTGDMAVATFWGVQETGGSTPSKAQGLVTYVFAKLDGVWKLTRAVVSLSVAPNKPS
jgi:ketosteroid isomerase-like protein